MFHVKHSVGADAKSQRVRFTLPNFRVMGQSINGQANSYKHKGEVDTWCEMRADIIITYINRCKAGGKSEEVIISDLEQYFDHSETEARELYEKYVGQRF